jgi:ABC-type antimicrobial peptide transport system permease subunit
MDDQIQLRTIVGVVRPVQLTRFGAERPDGHYYAPSQQLPPGRAFLIVRTRGQPAGLQSALRSAVLAVDPELPIYDLQTMNERMAESRATDRVRLILLLTFSLIALFLSGIGLYGVLAYTVAQRTSELGIRLALGSSRRDVFGLVLRQGMRLTATGLVLGLAASLGLSRLLRTMLYEVQPNDPLVFAAVFGVLTGAALLACLLPARRATRIDPMLALRDA